MVLSFPSPSDTILVLAPHTDDGEFGCGGTIAKFIDRGSRVVYAAFSAAETSVPPEFPRDILRHEVKEATGRLGIKPEDCRIHQFEVRRFPEQRQEILDAILELSRELRPSLVFVPSQNDTHQDHQTISYEAFRAFKRTTMLGYEVPWNNLNFTTSCFVGLSNANVEAKLRALEAYRSQASRSYASADYIRALATTRGMQINRPFAEAFEVVRLVID